MGTSTTAKSCTFQWLRANRKRRRLPKVITIVATVDAAVATETEEDTETEAVAEAGTAIAEGTAIGTAEGTATEGESAVASETEIAEDIVRTNFVLVICILMLTT